jgi:hypothetical protein
LAAAINYEVPLLGAYTVTRFIPILLRDDWFTDAGRTPGISLKDFGVIEDDSDNRIKFKPERLRDCFEHMIPVTANPNPYIPSSIRSAEEWHYAN